MNEMDISYRINEVLGFDNSYTIKLLSASITLQFKVIDADKSIYEKDYYIVYSDLEKEQTKLRHEGAI